MLRLVDDETADALALAENFVREAMHPMDEAIAFAKLASEESKGVEAIAAEFGISRSYVLQRMKLAILAAPQLKPIRPSTAGLVSTESGSTDIRLARFDVRHLYGIIGMIQSNGLYHMFGFKKGMQDKSCRSYGFGCSSFLMTYGAAMTDPTQLERCGEFSGHFARTEAVYVTVIKTQFG